MRRELFPLSHMSCQSRPTMWKSNCLSLIYFIYELRRLLHNPANLPPRKGLAFFHEEAHNNICHLLTTSCNRMNTASYARPTGQQTRAMLTTSCNLIIRACYARPTGQHPRAILTTSCNLINKAGYARPTGQHTRAKTYKLAILRSTLMNRRVFPLQW